MSDALADDADADVASEHWEVAAVLAGGDSPNAGGFKFFVADQRWVWSEEVARMHGYAPGQVEPTTELLLSHKHPDDRARVAEILERVRSGGLFSGRHRIIDTEGRTHWMVVVGDHMTDEAGEIIGTQGYYVDVTDGMQADLTSAMKQVVDSRATIEQAKGVLMVAYGIDADRAFDILTWRSQLTHVKVKTVAAQFLAAVMRDGLSAESVGTIDRLLLPNDPVAR
ncbi:antitermination regulator [Mycobacterium sp. ST-F2]|uniref:PAS and ANTAR domain-containing protein n=1 Tax=Mycobacterium sp. ST-F2 TaxID=1490484 RepID=UPI00095BD5D4|nr:PAS and ANTAR domain-containing protein [Mycobacterium sp. ST-F2]OKH83095.1 antitermination regulator [Mycobacterium sp. ST-F2]